MSSTRGYKPHPVLGDVVMRRLQLIALALGALLVLSAPATGLAHDKKHKEYEKGQAFCPTHVLVVGNVVVQARRCYVLAVLRDGRATFLAFVDPVVKIPSGRVVRLDSEEGRKVKARIIYLVPLQATGLAFVVIPVNTIQLVQVREEDEDEDDDHDGKKVVLVVTGLPLPNLMVTFVVRF